MQKHEIDICPSCEEDGDSRPKPLCPICGFCVEKHHEEYCDTAKLLRAYLKHTNGERDGKRPSDTFRWR